MGIRKGWPNSIYAALWIKNSPAGAAEMFRERGKGGCLNRESEMSAGPEMSAGKGRICA